MNPCTISGTVLNPAGDGMTGRLVRARVLQAVLDVTGTVSGAPVTAKTDADGAFEIDLPQGATCRIEIPETGLDAVFVAVGGGGLISGIANYVKAVRPEIKVIGVQTSDSDAMIRSVDAGHRVELENVGLFSDGTAVKLVGEELLTATDRRLRQLRATLAGLPALRIQVPPDTPLLAELHQALSPDEAIADALTALADEPAVLLVAALAELLEHQLLLRRRHAGAEAGALTRPPAVVLHQLVAGLAIEQHEFRENALPTGFRIDQQIEQVFGRDTLAHGPVAHAIPLAFALGPRLADLVVRVQPGEGIQFE